MVAEARISPRYSRQLEVNIDGLKIRTTNVAHGGVQLCCPQMRYSGLRRAEKDGVITLQIRSPGTGEWLTVAGRVCYANPADDEYLIGIQFTKFDSVVKKQWLDYIGTLSDPALNG